MGGGGEREKGDHQGNRSQYRASDTSRKKVKSREIFRDKFAEKNGRFRENSRETSSQISPKNDR